MPDRDPEKTKQAKRKWYLKNKERVLQQKCEKRAAQKKLKPPKPPPTPEEIAKARELNWLAGNRYRAKCQFVASACSEPRLLPTTPRPDCPAATGPSCPEQTDSQSVPKVACVGRRVCCPFVGAGSWIRQDCASPPRKNETLRKTKKIKNCIGSATTLP